MKTGIKKPGLWLLVCLLGLLAACVEGTDDPGVVQTPTLETVVEPQGTAEILTLPQNGQVPTTIALSQFPVALIDYISAQRPGLVSLEMAGFGVTELTWQIGQAEENCSRMLAMELIAPTTAGGESGIWQDGVHTTSFSWLAAGHFLSDGEQGDYVYVQQTEIANMISGRFRSAASGEIAGANLLLDPVSSQLIGLQTQAGDLITAVPGDGFQLFKYCLEADGSIRSDPGVELLFSEGGQFVFEQRPLPSGEYFLYLTAGGPANRVTSITNFPVNNDGFVPGYQVYLDTAYGFQFLYPVGWAAPQLVENRLVTSDSSGSTSLTITTHPEMANRTPSDLKNQALAQFGNVPVLFEDQVSIGETGALWTAYGYTGNDGSHTGILLTFIRDNVGYTVDLDGLESAEEQTIIMMDTVAKNWLFRPDIIAPRALEWSTATQDGLTMPVKANYYQELLDNGWRRLTVGDGQSFMSFRSEPPDGQDLAEVIGRWQAVAERDVTEFVASEAYLFSLNDREWSRKDFAYTREDGSRIQGFFMAAELNNQVVIFWIEIPSDRYEQQSVEFLLSLAGLH